MGCTHGLESDYCDACAHEREISISSRLLLLKHELSEKDQSLRILQDRLADLHPRLEKLIEELDASERRRFEQAAEIMALQADLSTQQSRYADLWLRVEQLGRDCAGHNMCWRNTERFLEAVGLREKRTEMPPRDEFEVGCRAFQDEIYSSPERWPDFFELVTSGSR